MTKRNLTIAVLAVFFLCAYLLTACGGSDEPVTLESLLGENYAEYITDTITMQMGNRMDKNPEIRYFPIENQTPLSDYVTINEQTKFETDNDGNVVIFLPAGTVTEAEHGEQSFRMPKK